jgi:hypothetical protein
MFLKNPPPILGAGTPITRFLNLIFELDLAVNLRPHKCPTVVFEKTVKIAPETANRQKDEAP